MKVLLLGINARYTHINTALYYLRQSIAGLKFTVNILEKTINDNIWDIINDIFNNNPDILCLSHYIWNQKHLEFIIRDIKKILPNLKIICGGPDISYNAEEWLKQFPEIDYIIKGAGEKAFRVLAENNFHYDDKIICLKNYPFECIPIPYIEEDFQVLHNRYIYYEASRGCPFKCSYCMSSRDDQLIEYKSFNLVKSELDFLLNIENFKPIIIKFIDRSFNVNSDLAIQIWTYLKQLHTHTKFHFEIHPLYFTEDQYRALQDIPENRFQFEIGIQSIHNKTINLINRKGKWEEIYNKLKLLTSLKSIHLHFDLIAGLPGESYTDITQSFNQILDLKPDHFQPGFLKILPGTALEQENKKWDYRYQLKAPYRILSSSTISFKELQNIEIAETGLDILYNSNIFKIFISEYFKAYQNRYNLFFDFGLYLQSLDINKNLSDRKKIFVLLYEFIKNNIDKSKNELFLDCIRFDWFLQAKTHYYPEELDAIHSDKFKEKYYNEFKSFWQDCNSENIITNNSNIQQFKHKLKNVCFFAPKNALFMNRILNNELGMVIVNQTQIYKISNKNEETKIIEISFNDVV